MRNKIHYPTRLEEVSLPLTPNYQHCPLNFLLVQRAILLWGTAVQCPSPHPNVDICKKLTWAGHQSGQEILGSVWLDPVHVPGI